MRQVSDLPKVALCFFQGYALPGRRPEESCFPEGYRPSAHQAAKPRGKQIESFGNDMAEAFTIAERGEMRLHLTDCHLETARLALALGDKAQAREHWRQAATLIEQTGYHRRDGELAEIAAQL